MDDLSSIYSEKKLAHYETSYRENVFAKPQDVNVSITAAHIYGLAFICDQVGTKEGDPEYTRFSCGLEEVTKVYINNNNRNSPIYIQCDDTSKSVMNRRRIILPCFDKNEEIVKIIESAKAEFDKKIEKQKAKEKDLKLKAVEEAKAVDEAAKAAERERLKKAADAEFEALTAGYEKPAPAPAPAPKPAPAPDFSVADMLGIEEITGVAEAEPVVIEETKADFEEVVLPTADDLPTYDEVKPVDPNAPSIEELTILPQTTVEEEPVEEVKEAPKPAPAPAPAPAPVEEVKEAPKPAPAPAPAPAPVEEVKEAPKPAPAPAPAPAPVEEVKEAPKPAPAPAPAPAPVEEVKEAPKPAPAPAPAPAPVEEVKEAPKPAPAPAPAPKPAPAPVMKADADVKAMSLEEFQTAVMKLKSMLDSGVMTNEEFAEEKAKLLRCLY